MGTVRPKPDLFFTLDQNILANVTWICPKWLCRKRSLDLSDEQGPAVVWAMAAERAAGGCGWGPARAGDMPRPRMPSPRNPLLERCSAGFV